MCMIRLPGAAREDAYYSGGIMAKANRPLEHTVHMRLGYLKSGITYGINGET